MYMTISWVTWWALQAVTAAVTWRRTLVHQQDPRWSEFARQDPLLCTRRGTVRCSTQRAGHGPAARPRRSRTRESGWSSREMEPSWRGSPNRPVVLNSESTQYIRPNEISRWAWCWPTDGTVCPAYIALRISSDLKSRVVIMQKTESRQGVQFERSKR